MLKVDTANDIAWQRRMQNQAFLNGTILETDIGTPHKEEPEIEPPNIIINTSKLTINPLHKQRQDWELKFYEVLSRPPITRDDYVRRKVMKRGQAPILCGYMSQFITPMSPLRPIIGTHQVSYWQDCWVELYVGAIVIESATKSDHELNRVESSSRMIYLTAGSTVKMSDLNTCVLSISGLTRPSNLSILSSNKKQSDTLTFQFHDLKDLFVWWWLIQYTSPSRIVRSDGELCHKLRKREIDVTPTILSTAHKIGRMNLPQPAFDLEDSTDRISNASTEHTRPSILSNFSSVIYLVCHGETEHLQFVGQDRIKGLTERGRWQAELTAKELQRKLMENGATKNSVKMIYGGLKRTVESAQIFNRTMPWLAKRECALLENALPEEVTKDYRPAYRKVQHQLAYEFLCGLDHRELKPQDASDDWKSHKIIICSADFAQYCIARVHGVPLEIITSGAPMADCSITEIHINDSDATSRTSIHRFSMCSNNPHDTEACTRSRVVYANRVSHLPLLSRTLPSHLPFPIPTARKPSKSVRRNILQIEKIDKSSLKNVEDIKNVNNVDVDSSNSETTSQLRPSTPVSREF